MAEALYRKYRPNTFDDVVGQEHIERTLKNAIEQNKVSHAYLFCGPRGTGKTTMARILSKALLCEKAPTVSPDGTCAECEAIAAGTHPDVYELDAASRTGVENVREEIINRVHYAPTRGNVKVYIIDEVHMLSTAAFNALLKTLEEPPSHVVFILCTTDPQKVPETIHSRCQRFDFHRLGVDEIVTRLGAVCVQENVEFEAEALELIAHQADGGMRNALTSLEQLAAFGEGHVTLEGAHRILGSLDNEGLAEIVQALGRRDAAACFTWVSDYVETGADIAQFVQDLAEYVRNLYLLSLTNAEVEISVSSSARATMEAQLEYFGPERLSRALGVLGDLMKELRSTTNSRLAFEIALTRLLRPEADLTIEALSERLEELELKMLSAPVQPAVQPFVANAPQVTSQVEPSAQAASAPQPAPSPQQVPAPQPAPVPQPTPTPQPAPVPQPVFKQQASPVSQPVSAPQAGVVPQVEPVAQPAPISSAAPFDFGNPAALQRMWHQVTTTLRKANPARGVLFMGAKIEPNAQGNGVNIVFAADSSFAYTAAQKPEVKDLLAQTFIAVTGATIPFQLSMAGSRVPAQPSVASAQTGTMPAVAPTQTGTMPAVAPAQTNTMHAVPSPQMETTSEMAPSQTGAMPVVAPAQADAVPATTSLQQEVAPAPVSDQAEAVSQASTTPRYEDESPFFEDDASFAEELSESDQIKQILTASFGDGVKFDNI